jgi:Mrp family chromosome partitioning ATPase
MRSLLAVARRRADVVVVAAPSMTAGADVLALAPLCDETIIVVRERVTTRDDARRVRDALEAASARVRGIILEDGGRAQPWPARRQRRPAWRMALPVGRSPDVEPPTPRVAAKA